MSKKLSNLSSKFIEVINEKSMEILEDNDNILDYSFQKPEKKKK